MIEVLGYALLPSIIISSTALVIMLFAAIQREHRYTSLLTSLGLLLALIVQLKLIGTEPRQSNLFLFDGTTALLSALLILVALLLSLLLYSWLESLQDPKEEYYLLFLLATEGALVLCASTHFASFFLGLELMSLSLIPMIAYQDRNSLALEAGIKYLVLSAIASAFMLLAIALIYFYTGTLAFGELARQLPVTTFGNDLIYSATMLMLLVGLAFKLSLAPCHLWVADLFEGSPLPTAAMLTTLSKAAVFVVLIRLFSYGEWHQQNAIITVLAALAVASMLVGNFLALRQQNLMRLLAFSSIAHFGYILLAVLALKPALPLLDSAELNAMTFPNEAAIYYLFAYLITTVGTFALLMVWTGQLARGEEAEPFSIARLQGLFWTKPATATALTLLLLSLAGMPLTVGFIGKFYLTLAAANAQLWWLLAALVIGSIAGLYFYLRVILMMTEAPNKDRPETRQQAPIMAQLVVGLVVLSVLGLGIFPSPLADLIKRLVLP